MSDQNSSVGKWLAGILATIISGVGVYYATGRGSSPSPPQSLAATVSSPLPNREESKPNADTRQPESAKLVGTWRANVVEYGVEYDVVWHARPNGTTTCFINSENGAVRLDGKWQYSGGILYETFQNGASARGAIEHIDSNQFIVTIIDNGIPDFSGVKRHYYRQ